MDGPVLRVLGLVPARGGSKGVPRKNARLIHGRPLLAWTAESALAASALDRVVLSTDDDEIAAIGIAAGLDVPFRRPPEIATDTTPMIDVILHAMSWLEDQGESFDAICLLQPTNPLRSADDIDRAVALMEATDADTVLATLAIPAEHHPDWAFVTDAAGDLHLATGGTEPISRRQDLRPAYHREGSLYLTRWSVVQDRRSLYGPRIRSFPIDPARSVNIDTPDDWDRAARMLGAHR